jgi:putative PEP-CTERM system histidine kinase
VERVMMTDWLSQLGGVFAALALCGYAVAALWLALRPARLVAPLMPSRAAMVAALVGIGLWALLWSRFGAGSVEAALGSAARNLGLLIWLAATFGPARGYGRALSVRLALLTLLVINLIALVFGGLALVDLALAHKVGLHPWLAGPLALVDMLTASAALVLTENFVRHKHAQLRMPLLVAAGGMAALWAYALNIHLLGWLAGRPPTALMQIEPLAALAVLPVFVLAALDTGRERIRLSRTIAVRTIAVMGLAIYLSIIALTGALTRVVGGDYGDLAQGVLLIAALGGGALIFLSARARAWLIVMISKHFFEHRYDYRSEWMRFTATLEGSDGEGDAPFRRVARALAALTDSPGAVVLVADDSGDYRPADHWQWPTAMDAAHLVPVRSAFVLQESGRIVDLDAGRTGDAEAAGIPLPAWLVEDKNAWVLLPLLHLGRLAGIALLQRPAAPRPLDWEDLDVLRISSRQAASHIAEVQSQAALSEARRFDEFNRRFAFIMHDVKNLASQLGLLAANAERHADNPEFRADMIETLKLSVARMNDLLLRLSAKRGSNAVAQGIVSLAPLLNGMAADASRRHPVSAGCDLGIAAWGDEAAIRQILGHLVANAIDASPAGAPVLLSAALEGGQVRIDVFDHGKGMNPEFVRSQLFKPFVSTKDNGFGLGAFEALQLARAMGGRLDVESREGEGTRFTLWLAPADAHAHLETREQAA